MLQGFKEFILRGNVIDLAVAVVIGTAFTAVVAAIVNNLFNPLIGAIFNAKDLENAMIVMIGSAPLKFGAVLAALIQFVLIAAVVYFVFVVPMNHILAKRRNAPIEEAETAPTELELLADIRDLLAGHQEPAGGKHSDL
ncbi:MAG: large conductance mechanosensitive channel protein MscL [Microbacteriaceae bacterium]